MITGVWPTPAHPERAPFVVRQVEFLRRVGISVDVVHLDGRGQPSRYVQRWREVRTLIARNHYDVVHAQWGQSALAALPRVAPLVVTFRGSDLEGVVSKSGKYGVSSFLLTCVSQIAARCADEVIVVSDRLARRLPSRRCHVIPSGVDLELFVPRDKADARQRLGLKPVRRYVLFAASPANPVKRHALALQAMEALEDTGAELLVVERVSPATMPCYMSACDVLLLTSAHEGSPNVVKEALACNLPVVGVDVGDVRQRLNLVAGCVVCADDAPHTIASGLRQALAHDQPIDGRSAVAALDERVLTERVVDVYRQAMARWDRRTRRDGV